MHKPITHLLQSGAGETVEVEEHLIGFLEAVKPKENKYEIKRVIFLYT